VKKGGLSAAFSFPVTGRGYSFMFAVPTGTFQGQTTKPSQLPEELQSVSFATPAPLDFGAAAPSI
jgi:hypothetical protein